MVDVVDPQTRSRMMSGIRNTDTKPELQIRRALHARGFRFRLHSGKLAGKPDIILPKYKTAVFIHGCFWHRHECYLFKWPATRQEFWREKLTQNATRDRRNIGALLDSGWKVAVIWECSVKGASPSALSALIDSIEAFLTSEDRFLEISSAIGQGKHRF